jgi:hypothetical protein
MRDGAVEGRGQEASEECPALSKSSAAGSRQALSDGLPAFIQLDRPTVSAIAAPRSPIGLSCPVVESRAV